MVTALKCRSLVLVPLGLTLVACRDGDPTAPAADGLAASAVSAASAQDRPDEAEMRAFAARIPGLGGYYFDDSGDLVVYVTDPAQAEAARAALAEVSGRGRGRILIRPALYTFIQLAAWRDAWSDRILDVRGVSFLDLDEAANRIVVGTAEAAARERVLGLLRESEIPIAALEFESVGYARSLAVVEYAPYLTTAPTQGDSIISYRRPLEGGLKITYRHDSNDPDYATTCTLGFPARLDNVRIVITASHCSKRHWDFDNTTYFQARPGAMRYFGYEYRDPNGTSCGFLSVNVCRNSDASAIYIEADVRDSLGFIARPVGPPPEGRSPYGIKVSSLLVDQANPTFRIVGKGTPDLKLPVDKVGVTTGWTRGELVKTCVDVQADRSYSKLRCQSYATFSATKGDSGAPVFHMHADGTVTLVGMMWGGTSDDLYAIFSSVGQIEKDLGTLHVAPSTTSSGGDGSDEPDLCPPNCVT